MITDLNQSAKYWLADHLVNFSTLLDAGDDPSCIVNYQGIEIEIRLNKCPGVFDRQQITIEK